MMRSIAYLGSNHADRFEKARMSALDGIALADSNVQLQRFHQILGEIAIKENNFAEAAAAFNKAAEYCTDPAKKQQLILRAQSLQKK